MTTATALDGEGGAPTLEERAREVIWRLAVWQDDAEDPRGNCTWEYALDYEEEMGELVPRTIDAAREVHALYADALAALQREIEALREALQPFAEYARRQEVEAVSDDALVVVRMWAGAFRDAERAYTARALASPSPATEESRP